jgi:hypothetical protein
MLRIRHVAVCTADPWGSEARVADVLGLAVVQRDKFNPAIGIRNGVFALQSTFLEVTTPGAAGTPTQRFLDKHGDGGYMICLQVDDLDVAKARAIACDVRIVLSIDAHRDGDQVVSAVHLHPADTGGALFSFEQADPPDSWAYAGEAWRDYRRDGVVRDIVAVEIESPQPARLIERLARLFDRPADGNVLQLDRSRLLVCAAPPQATRDRFIAIDCSATDRSRVGEEHVIAGTRFRFV